jgi:hypothetical protein
MGAQMKEVVAKLLDQARAECFSEGCKPATTVGYDELEKLVELVVMECIDIVAAGGEFASRPKLRIVEKLQQHFGVK